MDCFFLLCFRNLYSLFLVLSPGVAAAAKIYLESLSRVAKQAQQGTCGGTADIGKILIYFLSFQQGL